MNFELVTVFGLLGIIVTQQVVIQRLVNKLMSRNYAEYEQSVAISKTSKSVGKSKGEQDAPPEDFRVLQEFSL